jgi:hypothetical protein
MSDLAAAVFMARTSLAVINRITASEVVSRIHKLVKVRISLP